MMTIFLQRQEAEASRKQAAEAFEKLNALHELHQTAEKKAEVNHLCAKKIYSSMWSCTHIFPADFNV